MTEPATIGSYLRAARRRQRLSIERAAEDTRIRPDFLMRMESDEFDFLATAYVRGFLRTYARYLRVPVEPILDEFDRRFGGRSDTASMLALERRQRTVPKTKKLNSWAVAAIFAAVALVGLALLGLALGPDDEGRPSSDVVAGAGSPTPEPTPEPTPSPTVEPTVSPTPSPTPSADVLAFDDGIEIQVTASREPCWVEIDADGADIFGDTLEVGERRTFEADAQMSVVLGFPAGVDLVINGVEIPSENLYAGFESPQGQDPIVLTLPDDAELLL